MVWPRLRRVENAEAYTRKIITTTAISWWRRRSWDAEQPRDDVPGVPILDHSDRVADFDVMWTELQALPPDSGARSCCASTRTCPRSRPRARWAARSGP
ncbi:MAG: hypothetical protein ACRDP2_08255 [Nocardioidaceae bacterium]